MPGLVIRGVRFDVHTLIFATLAILLGYQSIIFAVFTKTFAISERLMPEDRRMTRFLKLANLERGLIVGVVSLLIGLVLLTVAVIQWWDVHFQDLDYTRTMRWVIPGALLTAIGFQTILSSFFISILRMHRQ